MVNYDIGSDNLRRNGSVMNDSAAIVQDTVQGSAEEDAVDEGKRNRWDLATIHGIPRGLHKTRLHVGRLLEWNLQNGRTGRKVTCVRAVMRSHVQIMGGESPQLQSLPPVEAVKGVTDS
ncbi:unnamed protein product [Allacma fusca]|uniref:Uncharacterized protein n=1 Tax=Allacma fusca TaxID=39272 RepID=A0A8J2JPR3_9HEXA|nr:unnamed protein product [Allacma fusca]